MSLPASETLPSYSLQNTYYSGVFSIGPKTNRDNEVLPEVAYVASICLGSQHCVQFQWEPVRVDDYEGEVEYSIYRRKKGELNFTNKIATTDETQYVDTDSSLQLGQSYIYQVGIIVDGQEFRGESYLPEIEIIKPEANLAFVHRWMVNFDICKKMGRGVGSTKGIELENDYRCQFNGFGGESIGGVSYYDFSNHLLVDRFENSCLFTKDLCLAHDPGDASSTNDCFGTASPNATGVTGPLNSVFYQRGNRSCYINTDGAGNWLVLNSASPVQRKLMVSNFSGEPPFGRMNQPNAQSVCTNRSVGVDAISENMKLPSRRSYIAYTSWSSSLSDSEITDLEAGSDVEGNCNSDSGHSLIWDDTYPPSSTDFQAGTTGAPFFASGSDQTSQCVSRYGVQDAVGNMYEWTSDQIDSNLGVVSTTDPTNTWMADVNFDDLVAPSNSFSTDLSTYSYLNIPLGLPLSCTTMAPEDPLPACQTDDSLVAISNENVHGDKFWLHNSNNRGGLVGGIWADGTSAGRLRFAFDQALNNNFSTAGVRCVVEIEN